MSSCSNRFTDLSWSIRFDHSSCCIVHAHHHRSGGAVVSDFLDDEGGSPVCFTSPSNILCADQSQQARFPKSFESSSWVGSCLINLNGKWSDGLCNHMFKVVKIKGTLCGRSI